MNGASKTTSWPDVATHRGELGEAMIELARRRAARLVRGARSIVVEGGLGAVAGAVLARV